MNYKGEWAYAHTRLNGTFVRTRKNSVVYVEAISRDGRATIRHLRTGRTVTCSMTNLNVDPIELGYVNHPTRGPVYVSRKPMRRDWRQGIRDENVILSGGGRLMDILEPLEDEICKGNYPSFINCLSMPKGGAFSKKFSVAGGLLYYKGIQVGTVQNNEPCLDPKYLHLSELLRESYAT